MEIKYHFTYFLLLHLYPNWFYILKRNFFLKSHLRLHGNQCPTTALASYWWAPGRFGGATPHRSLLCLLAPPLGLLSPSASPSASHLDRFTGVWSSPGEPRAALSTCIAWWTSTEHLISSICLSLPGSWNFYCTGPLGYPLCNTSPYFFFNYVFFLSLRSSSEHTHQQNQPWWASGELLSLHRRPISKGRAGQLPITATCPNTGIIFRQKHTRQPKWWCLSEATGNNLFCLAFLIQLNISVLLIKYIDMY